jgi:hypothetical protein
VQVRFQRGYNLLHSHIFLPKVAQYSFTTSQTETNFSPGFLSLFWYAIIESQAKTALSFGDIRSFHMGINGLNNTDRIDICHLSMFVYASNYENVH